MTRSGLAFPCAVRSKMKIPRSLPRDQQIIFGIDRHPTIDALQNADRGNVTVCLTREDQNLSRIGNINLIIDRIERHSVRFGQLSAAALNHADGAARLRWLRPGRS